jgi:hypothetical protein
MTPIGEYRATRLTCADGAHLPGCYNPSLNLTACRCGAGWWVGAVGVWHSTPRYAAEPAAVRGEAVGEFYGWDTYFLHATGCPERHGERPCSPCGGAEPSDYATAAAQAASARAQHADPAPWCRLSDTERR